MAKKNEIIVKDVAIKTMSKDGIDYISITDIARQKNAADPNGVIANWMRNRNTVEFLGIWESLHNPNFNPLEFAIKSHLIPEEITPAQDSIIYAEEADVLNVAIFGYHQRIDMPVEYGEYQCCAYQ